MSLNGQTLLEGVQRGDPDFLTWLRERVRLQAAPRFSAWAWEWIEDDFFMDLVTQLSVTVTRPEFVLKGNASAYVDTAIRNLCKSYFRHIARMRRHASLDLVSGDVEIARHAGLEQVALAMDLVGILSRLGEGCRNLLLGKYIEGLSLKELGDRIGIRAQTVQSRLHTCREKLRTLWFERT